MASPALAARTTLVGIALMLCACAATRTEVDGLCPAIVAFANAPDSVGHSVALTTDWGGVYTKSEDPDEWIMAAKGCDHGGYEPGKVLCAYLLEETSTEFSEINHYRALRCLGIRALGPSPTNDHKLPPSASSRHMAGVRRGLLVKVEKMEATDTIPPTLKISVSAQP